MRRSVSAKIASATRSERIAILSAARLSRLIESSALVMSPISSCNHERRVLLAGFAHEAFSMNLVEPLYGSLRLEAILD